MSLSTENRTSLEEALNSEEREKWLDAIKSEVNSLSECKTWVLVDKAPDMHVISCK